MQNDAVTRRGRRRKMDLHFIGAVIWMFFLLYQPPLNVSIIYVIAIFSVGYLLLMRVNLAQYLAMLIAFAFMFVYLLLIVFLNAKSISGISHVFWMLSCTIPSTIAFSEFVNKADKNMDYFFKVLFCAASLQALLAYASLFSENIHEMFFEYMIETGLYTADHIQKWGHRIYGYGLSLMYAIPVVQGCISAWAVLFGIERKQMRLSVLGILILITAVINAKVSVLVFAAVLGIGVFSEIGRFRKQSLRILIIVIISGIVLTYAYNYMQENRDRLAGWLSLLFDSEAVSDHYLDYYSNIDRWGLPDGFGMIFGTGEHRPNYDVDMGFVNDIWIGGMIYSLFTVVIVLVLMHRIRKNKIFPLPWRKIIAMSLGATFVIANVKGGAFSYSAFMSFFFVIAFFSGKNGHLAYHSQERGG